MTESLPTPYRRTVTQMRERSDSRHYLLIVNPVSGPDENALDLAGRATTLLLEEGHQVTAFVTREEGDAYRRAKEPGDVDVVVAMGGDGTADEVGCALIGTDRVMGLLPNGSGNGLARELHIPMEIEDATRVLMRHDCIRIDTGEVNGRPFLCTCGIGLDAAVSEKFSQSKTRGFLRYIADTLDIVGEYHPQHYRITIDGRELEADALVVAVANASQYGNNAFIAPDASMTDGKLDVTILHPFPAGAGGRLAYRLFSGELTDSDYTEKLRGGEIGIRGERPAIYHIDGDPKPETDRLEVKVVPKSLTICAGRAEDREKTIFDLLHDVRDGAQKLGEDVADFFSPNR